MARCSYVIRHVDIICVQCLKTAVLPGCRVGVGTILYRINFKDLLNDDSNKQDLRDSGKLFHGTAPL